MVGVGEVVIVVFVDFPFNPFTAGRLWIGGKRKTEFVAIWMNNSGVDGN